MRNLFFRAGLCCLVISVVQGCVDFAEVSKFASAAADQKQYQSLVDGYAEYPMRLKRYRPQSDYDSLTSRYERRKAQRKDLMALHTVLSDYMGALATLTSDDLVNYEKDLKGLGTALQGGQFIDADQAAAFNDLARIISRAATDAYRQRQVSKVLQEANPHVLVITTALADITGETLIEDIANERVEIDRYYRPVLGTAGSPTPINSPALVATDQERKDRYAELDARAEAAKQYASVVTAIGKAHHKLTLNASKLSAAEALGIAAAYAEDIDRAKQTIDKLLEKAEK